MIHQLAKYIWHEIKYGLVIDFPTCLVLPGEEPVDELGDPEPGLLDVPRRVLQVTHDPLRDVHLQELPPGLALASAPLPLLGLQKPHELRARDYLGVPRIGCEVGLEKLAVVVKQFLHEAEEVVEADVAGAAAVVLAEPVFEDARCYCKLHQDMNQVCTVFFAG